MFDLRHLLVSQFCNWVFQVASISHSGSLQLQAKPGSCGGEEEHELRLLHWEEEGGGAHRQ